jgi:hypothetical protein
LLSDDRARADPSTADEVADANLHHVATTQLAVDRKVEQGPISEAALTVQEEPDSPNLLRLERALCTELSCSIPRAALRGC